MVKILKIKQHLQKIFDKDLQGNQGFSEEQIDVLSMKLIRQTETFIENQTPSLKKVINKYKQKIDLDPKSITDSKEQWITVYGDSFQRTGESPLKTLKYFLDKYLGDIISGVHILPCFETPKDPKKNDGGFAIIDHEKINPNLGTWEDIHALGENRQLMFDFIINHVSTESKWFTEWLNGNPKYENFFIEVENENDPRLQLFTRPRTTPLIYEHTKANNEKVKLIHTFGPNQVDLNLRNPVVFLKMFEILFLYIKNRASKIRLDAIGYSMKILGTNSMNLPQVHELIKLMRTILEYSAPHVKLVAEVVATKEEVDEYFGNPKNPNEVHEAYMFSPAYLIAKSLITNDATELKSFINNNKNKGTYLGTAQIHDGMQTIPGMGFSSKKTDFKNLAIMASKTLKNKGKVSLKSFKYDEIINENEGITEEYFSELNEIGKEKYFKITEKNNVKNAHIPYELNTTLMDLFSENGNESIGEIKFRAMHTFLYSLQNIPMIYYNSIFGKRNDQKLFTATQLNRDINRGKNSMDSIDKTLASTKSTERKTLDWFKTLLKIRSKEKFFHPMTDEVLMETENQHVVGVTRQSFNRKKMLVSLINISNSNQTIEVNILKSIKVLFTSAQSKRSSRLNAQRDKKQRNIIKMEPYQCIWLKGDLLWN